MGCCCTDPKTDLLNSIFQINGAIAVRWQQVFQATGVVPVPAFTGLADSEASCSDTELELLEDILTQRQAIYNAMFFG